MKYFITILTIFLISFSINAQITVWSEDFDGNGGSGSNWGTLNQDIGIQGITPNGWFISGQECGNGPGACGSACGGDFSLHVSSFFTGDIGAAYMVDATCLPGCFLCDFLAICIDVNTNKRSQSQNINTVGQTNLTLNFNYIENGQGTSDDCILEYSINGGGSWLTLVNTPKLALGGCAPQGTWGAYSIALPATCENITNFRIGYRWQNNGDGVGSDPSFAVDDIVITKPGLLPITLLSFKASHKDNEVLLEWVTESEINNDFFTIERSTNAIDFSSIATIKGAGNSTMSNYYSTIDKDYPVNNTLYYRLKQTDFDGRFSYSEIVPINTSNNEYNLLYANQHLTVSTIVNKRAIIEIYDITGKVVYSNRIIENKTISTTTFNSGIYIIKVGTPDNFIVRKMKF